ncbi:MULTISPECIES: 30S ribosomal protein S20 [Ammonifex]|uniref:Small ribosomal subunit protein bS20 n=2 Tax=Ammonifex TaxID=42837 RepID=C9R8P2_AMMDK|nr:MULTISPECIES: 30S ribosomal protein S20 [Ammonifex]ACX52671.1 ribosomal protein S20 [Ammonifex degensii KC4]RDV82892.1 30S ribosomal protein S20 [Ammonifex thiophilus]
MAKKSSLKRLRQIRKRTLRNKMLRSALKTAIKKFEQALAQGAPDVEEKLRAALRAIDKARTKGILHRNTAARKKSRLMRKYNQAKLVAS